MNNQKIAKAIAKRLAQQKRQLINKIVDNWKETKMTIFRTIPISNDMPHHAIARAMHHSFPSVKYEIDVTVDGLTDFYIVDKIDTPTMIQIESALKFAHFYGQVN